MTILSSTNLKPSIGIQLDPNPISDALLVVHQLVELVGQRLDEGVALQVRAVQAPRQVLLGVHVAAN